MSSFGGDDARSDPSIWHDYKPTPWTEFSKRVERVGGDLDEAAYEDLTSGPCTYCERDVLTGVVRVDNERGYWLADNVVSCCGSCNFAKKGEDVDAFLARTDAIARRHIEMPELLASIGEVAVNTSVRRFPVEMVQSGGGGDGDVVQPEDVEAFWESLDRRGAGKTTVFARVAAFAPYVDAVDAFVAGLNGDIRLVKMLTYDATGEQDWYVLMARAVKKYPALPWPKQCAACDCVKPIQQFHRAGPSHNSRCRDCVKSAAAVPERLARDRERKRRERAQNTEADRAKEAARKAAARAKARM